VRNAPRVPLRIAPQSALPRVGGPTALPNLTAGWVTLGLLLVAFAATLALASGLFGYAHEVGEMPVLSLVAGLIAAGLVYCLVLPRLVRTSSAADRRTIVLIMTVIVLAGLAARLALFASEPILEDDYQRYLWDGAVTASGMNPYAAPPIAARGFGKDTTLDRLAEQSGPVVRRINHPDLKTIYPPVAQAAFALAHLARPWSLTAWRAAILICELATLVLVLALLHECGRSLVWSALYWWNPLVIKELTNSAHMDAVVLPFVLASLLLAVRRREVISGASLALAAGAKIWPLILLPLVLRPLAANPRRLTGALAVFGLLITLLAAPVLAGGIDHGSGFAAYVAGWQTNSALFPALTGACATVIGWLNLADVPAGLLARLAIAVALCVLAGALSLRPIANADDLIGRASLVVAALVLLSPAQFPWYAVWFAPFLAFRPWAGFIILTATAPLYYMSFYLTAAGEPALFKNAVVWMIWVPVWAALAIEAILRRHGAAQLGSRRCGKEKE
jgi:hypothetical protein